MCGRYALADPQSIPSRFDTVNKDLSFEPGYNIAPGYSTPIVIKKGDDKVVEIMKWGLIPFWADDPNIGYKMINARSEGIENKNAFRVPVRKRRCLIPATGFYEWKTLNLEGKPEKYPWYYSVSDIDIFAFAGVYDVWNDAEDKEIYSYTIITTESNPIVNKVHPRMPVILNKNEEERWLDSGSELSEVLSLLVPYPADKMISTPVSRQVNSPSNDGKELIESVDRPSEENQLL